MNVVLTNQEQEALLISSPDEGGWMDLLQPQKAFTLNRPDTTLAIVGDKPSVVDNIEQGLKNLAVLVRTLLEKLVGERDTAGAPKPNRLAVLVSNNGSNAVRIVLGNGIDEFIVSPGTHFSATSYGYMELRELGHVQGQDDPGKQDEQTIA